MSRALTNWPIGAALPLAGAATFVMTRRVYLHRHQRIAVDIGILGYDEVVKSFADVSQTLTKFSAGYCAQ